MKRRRKARELALEVLYRVEITSDNPESILSDTFARTRVPKEVRDFTRMLVHWSLKERGVIDEIISSAVENWEFDRIALIDCEILRIAICEFIHFPDIPCKVSINEAIELAKKYSTNDSGRFVNGVLDRVLKTGEYIKK